jgi:S1-C subfamily serine protease
MERHHAMKTLLRTAAALAAFAAGLPVAVADTVVLKDGSRLEGIVIIQTAEKLVLKQDGGNKVIPLDQVDSVTKSERAEPARTPQPAAQPRAPMYPARVIMPAGSQGDSVARSVVKIYSRLSRPDINKPWARLPPLDEEGSGFVIEGKRILTSAHFVLYSSELQIKAGEAGDKLSAKVVAVAPALDIAVLKLDDESFFDSHPPVARWNDLPRTRDVASIYGFPSDSANVSTSRISVANIEFAPYFSGVSGLRIRLNGEFGAGVSGGPVLVNEHMIGMACEHPGASPSFGFVIPVEEINLFVDTAVNGTYRGKPAMHDVLQKLENPALREFLKLDNSVHGMVVATPGNPETPNGVPQLHAWDVVTQLGFEGIDDQGMVRIGDSGRVGYAYMVQKSVRAGRVPSNVVRTSMSFRFEIPAETSRPMLIPEAEGAYPSYFVFGPIVFSAATSQVVSVISASPPLQSILSYRGSPLVTRRTDRPGFDGEQLVYVPCPFFPHKLALGYGDPTLLVVKSVNGVAIRNLNHLVEVIRDSTDDFVTIEFVERDSEIMVFPRKAMIAATDDILNDNGVRSQGSADTMAVWTAK